ncbi:MAG: nucleic-acid-binding protein containing a Zn-ribbon [Actinomycetia bacterium]|nr:nucleic-acid-binding protein containing a Zn-ribbon [Actinomycetes bacterium]
MAPEPGTAETSPLHQYQEHLRNGSFRYQFSPRAGRGFFPPRVLCPFTGATELEWREASGFGTVHATTVVHPRDGEPYNVALVECDEGFRLMTRVEGIDPAAVAIGQRVRVSIRLPDGDEAPHPVFEPVAGEA